MIKILHAKGNKVEQIPVSAYKKIGLGIVWIDCLNPTLHELRFLAAQFDIEMVDLRESMEDTRTSGVKDVDHCSLIVFGAPYEDKRKITTTPISIFIKDQTIITLRTKELQALDKIRNISEAHKIILFSRGIGYFVYMLLDEITDSFFTILDDIEDNMDKIEKRIFRFPEKMIAKEIFLIKKTLIYFHKALTGNREVISEIEKGYVSQIKRLDKKFSELHNDIIQLLDMESTFRDILTGTLEVYLSSVSNNLNIIMKRLTVYASLVLVPTLISGVYGMNFANMPELQWKFGFAFAIGLMILSVIVMVIYFKRKKWI